MRTDSCLVIVDSGYCQATTVPTSIAGFGGGIAYFGSLDGSSLIMGIDPMFVYGAATLGCTGEVSCASLSDE